MEVFGAKVCSALPGILAATAAATETSLVRQTGGHTVSSILLQLVHVWCKH